MGKKRLQDRGLGEKGDRGGIGCRISGEVWDPSFSSARGSGGLVLRSMLIRWNPMVLVQTSKKRACEDVDEACLLPSFLLFFFCCLEGFCLLKRVTQKGLKGFRKVWKDSQENRRVQIFHQVFNYKISPGYFLKRNLWVKALWTHTTNKVP